MSNTDTSALEVRRHAYSVQEVAAAIGKSPQFVRNLITDSRLAAKYDGRAQFILPTELDRYLNNLPSERP